MKKLKKLISYIINSKHFTRIVILIILSLIAFSFVIQSSFEINTSFFKFKKEKINLEKLNILKFIGMEKKDEKK